MSSVPVPGMPPPTPEAHGTDAQVNSLRPGRVLFARYALERILGRGGMGFVWLAYDRNLARRVALKILSESIYCDPAGRDALKRETGRSVELTHANIVRVHDFVEDGETGA